jgi:TonB family protein
MNRELIASFCLALFIHLGLIFIKIPTFSLENSIILALKEADYSMEVSLIPVKVKEIKEKIREEKKMIIEQQDSEFFIQEEVKKKEILKESKEEKEVSDFSRDQGVKEFKQAVCLNNEPPLYPLLARSRGVEGLVELEIVVDREGKSKLVRVIKSSGHAILDESAEKAALGWRFIPAKDEGREVESKVVIPVEFNLEG